MAGLLLEQTERTGVHGRGRGGYMGGGEGVTDWRLRWPTCYSSRQRGRGYTGGGEGVTDRRLRWPACCSSRQRGRGYTGGGEGGTWEGERG